MNRIIIIEGVTGSGKSSVIRDLKTLLPTTTYYISEEETLGSLMQQVRDESWKAEPHFDALEVSLRHIEQHKEKQPSEIIVVERFHPTGYALFPYWEKLEAFDKRLFELGACIILLSFEASLTERRSIDRTENNEYADVMIAYYGSRENAIAAVQTSQQRRIDALGKTRLPYLRIDTSMKDWRTYANIILAFSSGGIDNT
ncbi:MAG TPA: hypothetical protein VEW28_08465 [Candidatus Kapabacteria bacterium]|nr:hypothetical protein [Candidatus Kapabacteria bacterium]